MIDFIEQAFYNMLCNQKQKLKEWRKFENVIRKAIDACKNTGISEIEHFIGANKTIKMPKGAVKSILNYNYQK